MTETERMLSQSLTRLEQNINARLTLYDTRLKTQEDNQMLLQAELRSLKRLFNDVSEVYASLQTILVRLRSGA
jgi:RNase H-fold protein (predicted Holliday junction resolvase)